ncbi:hypothetical protein AURDEDRAFT_171473 [Auricularia subglabra TFB-10046 SS5]|nr:hypothetical protein AURDEDRAFT_171473 [Auricularia subglabra TFB-10046 SS5]
MHQVAKRSNRRATPHVARACANCKERKIKCDGDLTGCATCAHRRVKCIPSTVPDRRTISWRSDTSALIDTLRAELAGRELTIAQLEDENAGLRIERDAWRACALTPVYQPLEANPPLFGCQMHGECFGSAPVLSTDALHVPDDPAQPRAARYDAIISGAVAALTPYVQEEVYLVGGSPSYGASTQPQYEARYPNSMFPPGCEGN